MLIFKSDIKGNVKADDLQDLIRSIQNNFNTLEDKYNKLETIAQSLCNHDDGFYFTEQNVFGYGLIGKRICKKCGFPEEYFNYNKYKIDKDEQKYKDAKKIVENYEKDNNVVQEK